MEIMTIKTETISLCLFGLCTFLLELCEPVFVKYNEFCGTSLNIASRHAVKDWCAVEEPAMGFKDEAHTKMNANEAHTQMKNTNANERTRR